MKYVDEKYKKYSVLQFMTINSIPYVYHITKAPAIITITNTVTLNSNNDKCF